MHRVANRAGLGVAIAVAVISAWAGHLAYALTSPVLADVVSVRAAFHLLLQAWLSTGLFITAHDAMHGAVSRVRPLNHALGAIAAFLFAGFSYRRLIRNHHLHHREPVSEHDPDFLVGSRSFWRWFLTFLWRYATVLQVVVMAAAYNGLHWAGIPEPRIWAFFVAPAFLAALQLFFFGTYLPHRLPVEAPPHRARSQGRNHPWALLSCYFFGYHHEHHASPSTPWWVLWRLKDAAGS